MGQKKKKENNGKKRNKPNLKALEKINRIMAINYYWGKNCWKNKNKNKK